MKCAVCEREAKPGRAGMCHAHYLRRWKYGDPLAVVSRAPKRPNPRRGEAHHFAKLSEAEARLALEAHEQGLSTRQLADKLEVSQSAIARLVSARNWKHL